MNVRVALLENIDPCELGVLVPLRNNGGTLRKALFLRPDYFKLELKIRIKTHKRKGLNIDFFILKHI